MSDKKPYLLHSRVLPDISQLCEKSKKLSEFNREFQGNAYEVLSEIFKEVDNISYKQKREEATFLARVAVKYTINVLSEIFNLDQKCGDNVPSVVLLDDLQIKKHKRMIALDDYLAPFSYVPLTYFTPRGIPYFDQPEGPVISFYGPSIEIRSVVEECFHFLHWFYETDRFEKGIRSPNVNIGYFNPKSEKGRIETEEVNGSPLLKARFVAPTIEEDFSSLIVSEAAAYYVISLFSLEDKVIMKDIQQRDNYVTLFKNLVEKGRMECYSKLLQSYEACSFDELMKRTHFSRLVGSFPSDVIHFLGYSLGQELHRRTHDKSDVGKVSNIVFSRSENLNKKLDTLITVLQ